MKRENPRTVRFSRDEVQALKEHLDEMKQNGLAINPNRFIRESVMTAIRSEMT